MAYILELSVHDIVDVLRRKGHLDNRIFNLSSMQEGTRLHSLYQSEQRGRLSFRNIASTRHTNTGNISSR